MNNDPEAKKEELNNNCSNKQNVIIIVKKVLLGIGIAICGFLVIVAGWLCIDKYLLKSPAPSFGGYSSLFVATGSMNGTINEGDLIIIKDTDEYKIGDIITFIKPGETIPTTHRIINFDSEGLFITKGDANDSKDKISVHEDEILGEVIYSSRSLGLFVGWVKEGGGYIYIIAAAMIIGFGIYLYKEESKKNKQVEEEKVQESEQE